MKNGKVKSALNALESVLDDGFRKIFEGADNSDYWRENRY